MSSQIGCKAELEQSVKEIFDSELDSKAKGEKIIEVVSSMIVSWLVTKIEEAWRKREGNLDQEI